MSQARIRSAIESRLASWAAARVPALPVAWENVPFTPPAGAYLRAFLLPASTISRDMKGDHRGYRGVYQVSVVVPSGNGPGAGEAIAKEVADLFPVNLQMTASGLTVQVVSPVSIANAIPETDRRVVPTSFEYRAQTY